MNLDWCDRDSKFTEVLEYITIGFSFASLICLCFFMKNNCKVSLKKMQSMNLFIIIIIISEIINSLDKIGAIGIRILFANNNTNENLNETDIKMLVRIFANLQAGFNVLSDNLTLLSSLFIALKIFDLTIYKNQIFRGCFKRKRSIYFIIFVSIIITAVSIGINVVITREHVFTDKECKVWFWVHSEISLCLHIYYFMTVLLIIILNLKSISLLQLREKVARQIEIDTQEEDENDNADEKSNNSLNSTKIHNLIKKLRRFPIATSIIWLFAFFDRLPDDILNIIYRDNTKENNNNSTITYPTFYLVIKYGLIIIHNLIGCFRGIIYTLIHFTDETKLCDCLCKNKEFKIIPLIDNDESAAQKESPETEGVTENDEPTTSEVEQQ